MNSIAIDLTSLAGNFSGIERYAAEMTLALIDLLEDFKLFLIFKDEVHPVIAPAASAKGINCVVVPSNGVNKLVFSQLILPKALKDINADINLFLAFPAPLLFKGRSVSTIHDLSCLDCPQTMTVKSRLLWKTLDTKAAKSGMPVITISEFSKSRILQHFGLDNEKVVVAYCGVNANRFNVSAGIGWEEEVRKKYLLPNSYVMSLSTIEPRKNLPLLIDACVLLWRESALDCDLVLAGRKGWKMDGLLEAIPVSYRNRVHFTGFVENDDLPVIYRQSQVFVFPSLYEGFGLPPVEAHNSGARVLCSDIPCLREICGDSVSYFANNSVNSLALELLKMLESGAQSKTQPIEYEWSAGAKVIADNLREMMSFLCNGSLYNRMSFA